MISSYLEFFTFKSNPCILGIFFNLTYSRPNMPRFVWFNIPNKTILTNQISTAKATTFIFYPLLCIYLPWIIFFAFLFNMSYYCIMNFSRVCKCTRKININHRIVETICEHIVTNNSLSSRGIHVHIDKSADCRIVVSALEVVEPGFLVVHVSTVAQRVDIC